MILPKKVSLELAIKSLGYDGLTFAQAFKSLIQLVKEEKLNLYLDSSVTGVYSDTETYGVEDPEGHFKWYSKVDGEVDLFGLEKPVLIRDPQIVAGSTEGNQIGFIEFFIFNKNDQNYYVVNTSELDEGNPLVSRGKYEQKYFFIEREGLSHLLQPDHPKDQTKKSVSPGKKHVPMQQRREDCFKTWLGGTTKTRITDRQSMQKAYGSLNQPTQKEIWEALQAVYPTLFSSGKDDFFRNFEGIQFAQGTGTGRKKR
jgi:hypothetical protein